MAAAFAAVLAANTPLETLRLAHCNLDAAGLGALCDALPRNTRLRTLDIRGNPMPAGFMRHRLLPAVRANTGLRNLLVSSTGLTNDDDAAVQRRRGASSLRADAFDAAACQRWTKAQRAHGQQTMQLPLDFLFVLRRPSRCAVRARRHAARQHALSAVLPAACDKLACKVGSTTASFWNLRCAAVCASCCCTRDARRVICIHS